MCYFFLSLSYRIYSIVHLPDISAVKNLQEKKRKLQVRALQFAYYTR
jgi:hypothetical protein